MVYEILVHETAAAEIEALRSYDQRRIVAALEEHLTHEPTVPARRRKCLVGVVPAFEHVLSVWELRVGTYRVFYDVDEAAVRVRVRAVRRKDATVRTKDIT